jgi:uncharacterized membrane protein YqjE
MELLKDLYKTFAVPISIVTVVTLISLLVYTQYGFNAGSVTFFVLSALHSVIYAAWALSKEFRQ